MASKRNSFKLISIIFSLLFFSFLLPEIFDPWHKSIVATLENSIWSEDKGMMIVGAVQAVAYQALIMFPYVTAGVLAAHYLTLGKSGWFSILSITCGLVLFFHYLFFQKLDYVPPYMVMVLILILTGFNAYLLGLGRTGVAPLVFIPGLIVLAVNSLSIAPLFAPFGFAKGDLTWEINLVGRFLRGETLLNITGIAFFIVLLVMALIFSELIHLYQHRLDDAEDMRTLELQRERALFQAEELRVLQEMHTLVHDLKTPLMTVQGLNSLLQLAVEGEQPKEYTRRIEGAVDNLNKMISEILYDEVRKEITIEQLVTYVRAHIPVTGEDQRITFAIEPDLPPIQANLIRLARALINLIENAYTAISGMKQGEIKVKAYTGDDNQVVMVVEDNGAGIPGGVLAQIWSSGYSSKSPSAGLGLGFVKRVIENHQGQIDIDSEPGRGTLVRISLPGVKSSDQNPNY